MNQDSSGADEHEIKIHRLWKAMNQVSEKY